MKYVAMWMVALVSLTACNTGESRAGEQEVAGGLREFVPDFQVSAEEGGNWVTCLLRFPKRRNGKSYPLPEGMKVSIDGQEILPDSAGISGIYYELQQPLESFGGDHTITIRGREGEYSIPFRFEPIVLENARDSILSGEDTYFELKGAVEGDMVHVSVIDTSFSSEYINKEEKVWEGKVMISSIEWAQLTPGPISLELSIEHRASLQEWFPKGGTIRIMYDIRRDLHLEP